MAGKIKNVVETQFRSSGAQKTVKDTESIGRAQTRLGQNSASTGRQFSSQAQGLGGLVGAYAAAAANIFAITAAFDALARAARAEQTIQGLNSLAATFGKTGDEILSSLQEITKGQLSTAELAQQANLALSAGLGNQLEGLTEVSLKASRALGRSLPDAFTRIIRGAGKLEPELLDELGIFTRIDPAVEKYALQTGKAASSLTNFERRQAFANAVLEEGQRKFSSINTTTATSAEKLEKLAATLVDIGTKIGSFVADVLAPFADFITDNLAAAVIAISFLIKQVLGSAFGLAANFVSTRVDTMVSKFSELSLKATASSQGFIKATENISNAAENITPKKLLGGKAAIPGKELVTQIKAGQMVSPAEAKAAAQTLRELADAQTKNIDRLKDGGDQAIKNRNALRALANEIDSLPAKTTKLSTVYSLAFRQMTAATKMLGTAVNFLLSAFNKLFFFVTTIETFFVIFNQITGLNFSPLAKLAELFDNLNRKSKQFSKTLGEVTTAFSADLNFDALRFSAEQVSEVIEEASGIIKDTLNDVDSIEMGDKLIRNVYGSITGFKLPPLIADEDVLILKILNEKLDEYREKSKKAGEEGRKAFAIFKILEKAEGYVTNFGKKGFDAINLLSSTTGVAAGEFKKLFDSGELKRFGSDIVLAFGGAQLAIKKVDGEYDSFTTQVTTKLASAKVGVNTFFAEFDRGVATAESAGQAVVKLENEIAQARKSLRFEILDAEEEGRKIDKERVSAAEELIKSLERQKDLLNEQKETLVALEDIQKKVKSNLSSDIKAFESAAVSGIIGSGGIAKTQEEQIKNQAIFQKGLLDTLTALEDIEAMSGEDVSNRSDILKLEEIVRDIVVSKLGSIIKISDETTKQLRDQEKLLPKLKEQLSILQRQTALKKQQSDIEIQTARDNLTQKALEQQISLQKVGVEISNINISKAKSIRDITVKQQEALLANLESQKKLLSIENQRRLLAIEARNDAKSFALEQFSFFQEKFPDLFTEEDLRKLKKAQANIEFNNQMEILNEKRAQAEKEYEQSLSILNQKKLLAQKEVENLTIANQAKINQIKQEALISDLESQKVAKNIENNLNALAKNEDIIRQQRDIQIAQINLQAKEQQNSLDSSRRQLEVLTKQAEVNDAFIKSQTDLINTQIALFNEQNKIAGRTIQIDALGFESISESVRNDLNKLSQGLSTQSENIENTRLTQIQAATNAAEKQIELNNISIRSLRQELVVEEQLAILQKNKFDARIAATRAASDAEIAAAETKVNNINTEIAANEKNQKLVEEKLNIEEERIKRTRDLVLSKLSSIVKISDEITKQLRDQEKLLPKLREQLSILQRQTALKKQQSDIEIQTARDNLTQKALEQQIRLQKVGVEISNINISKAKSIRDITVKQQEALLANLESQKKLLSIENQRRLLAIEARNDAKSFALEQFSAFQEQFPDLFTEEDLRKLREAQANLEFNNQMKILNEKRVQAEKEYEQSLSILNQKKLLAEKEVKNLTIANQAKTNQIKQEALISALENQKVANNIENNLNALAKNEDIIRQQRDIQIAQINLQAKEQQNSLDNSRRQLEVLTKQAEVNDAFIKSQIDFINKQIEIFNKQNKIEGSTVQVKALDYENISERVKNDLNKLSQGLSTQSENIESTRLTQIQAATDEAKKQIELNNISIRSLRQELVFQQKLAILQQKRYEAQIAATRAASDVELAAAETTVNNINTEIEATKKNQELLRNKSNVEEEGIKRAKEAALNKINLERDLLTDLGNDVAKILKDKIGQGIKDLSDAFVAGELTLKSFKNGFRDFLASIFDSIRTTLLEKTVIKPVQDFVTKNVVDFFDLGFEKRGIENAEVVNGALKVTIDNGDPIKQLQTDSKNFFKESDENNKSILASFSERLKADFGKFFEFLQGGFQNLGNFTSSIFSNIGNALNNAFGGSGGGSTLLGSLFKGIGGLFGGSSFSLGSAGSAAISSSIPNAAGYTLLNSGGLVQQLAQGGYIKQLSGGGPSSDYSSSLVNRDRVPALLEPGEFVMRRQAVKSMGVSNMQAINSGTTPKVEVTIKNEGTPQEATSATPRFDVDKIVIDVVTRDLRNNGPIRKTLRGGGGV